MRRRLPGHDDPHGRRGFVLPLVLWMVVLIGFIAAHLAATGRTETRIAANLVAAANAEAAAEGGIDDAIFVLSDPAGDDRWPLDGAPHALTIGESRVVVRVEDEASRINPNFAPPALFEGLLRATGTPAAVARPLALSLAEWVGTAPQAARPAPDDAPPGGPVESLDELGRVRGMTPAVLAAIRPHLTLFGDLNGARADPAVREALVIASEIAPDQKLGGVVAPPETQAQSIVRITAVASWHAEARTIRIAIVRVGPGVPQGYAMLAWERG